MEVRPQKPDGRKDESVGDNQSFAKVTNISGTSGMTHNGRIFVASLNNDWFNSNKLNSRNHGKFFFSLSFFSHCYSFHGN